MNNKKIRVHVSVECYRQRQTNDHVHFLGVINLLNLWLLSLYQIMKEMMFSVHQFAIVVLPKRMKENIAYLKMPKYSPSSTSTPTPSSTPTPIYSPPSSTPSATPSATSTPSATYSSSASLSRNQKVNTFKEILAKMREKQNIIDAQYQRLINRDRL